MIEVSYIMEELVGDQCVGGYQSRRLTGTLPLTSCLALGKLRILSVL